MANLPMTNTAQLTDVPPIPPAQTVLQFAGTTHPAFFHDADGVASHVRKVLAHWPQTDPVSNPDASTHIIAEPDGYYAFVSAFSEPISGLSDVGAACGVVVDAAQSFLAANPDYLCLHSATFEIGGKLVVMTGSAHAGKSTLAARMTAEDVLVYCDDMLPLIGPDNHGLALGLPPRPRMPLPENAGAVMEALVSRRAAARDAKYCYLDTHNLAPHGRTAPIGAVILLDRRADGPAGFAPASRAEALRHLIMRNMVPGPVASATTGRLDDLLGSVPCIKLHYSTLDDAAALLPRTFSDWSITLDDLLSNQLAPGAPLSEAQSGETHRHKSAIDAETAFVRAAGITARQVGAEMFLFDQNDRSVLNLNVLASAIWALLEEPICVHEASGLIAEIYPDIPATTIRSDVAALFADLDRAGLITPVNARK